MKIGVLTFHYALNFGAVLQTYATVMLLQQMGHEVDVIDYRNPIVEAGYKPFYISKKAILRSPFKYLYNFIPNYISKLSRAKNFRNFILENLNISLCPLTDYDVFIIGSDQVWNTQITGGFDKYYWGDIAKSVKKIAWAVSMNTLSISAKEVVQQKLRNFATISVREDSLKDLILSLTHKPITVLHDPVFNLSARQWAAIAPTYTNNGKPYILAYPMLWEQEVEQKAQEIAQQQGIDLIIISKNAGVKKRKGLVQTIGPDGFISYIKGAKMVVTSSFHGVAFSLIFNKPYINIVPKGERNLRVEALEQQSHDLVNLRLRAIDFLEKALKNE